MMLKYHFTKKDFLPELSCDFQVEFDRNNPLVIFGDNGIGKSTFLRMFFDEESIRYSKVLITQKVSPPFFDRRLSVLKNIIKKLPQINDHFFELLWNEFNFNLKENSHVSNLSGGERQMLHLACHLANQADVYLLDEPSVGLDVTNKKKLLKIIEMMNHNKIFVIVEHDKSWIPNNWPTKEIIQQNGIVRFSL